MTNKREFPIVKMETEEGRVLAENLIYPDSPERRKTNQKFARNNYRVVLGFPKESPSTAEFIKTFGAKAMKVLKEFFPDKTPDELKAMIKARLRDGDAEIAMAKKLVGTPRERKIPERWAGYWVLSATSKLKPVSVDMDGQPLTEGTCYAGMWAMAEIGLVPYSTGQGEGLACWVDAVVKTRDDQKFGRTVDTSNLIARARQRVVPGNPLVDEEEPF